jgi:hypothetical protein
VTGIILGRLSTGWVFPPNSIGESIGAKTILGGGVFTKLLKENFNAESLNELKKTCIVPSERQAFFENYVSKSDFTKRREWIKKSLPENFWETVKQADSEGADSRDYWIRLKLGSNPNAFFYFKRDSLKHWKIDTFNSDDEMQENYYKSIGYTPITGTKINAFGEQFLGKRVAIVNVNFNRLADSDFWRNVVDVSKYAVVSFHDRHGDKYFDAIIEKQKYGEQMLNFRADGFGARGTEVDLLGEVVRPGSPYQILVTRMIVKEDDLGGGL